MIRLAALLALSSCAHAPPHDCRYPGDDVCAVYESFGALDVYEPGRRDCTCRDGGQ